jgi:lambda repressor-like predicted transcriptional regulator
MAPSTFCLREARATANSEIAMNSQVVRIQLIRKGLLLKDLSTQSEIDYDRLQKVINGYRQPRPEEVSAIARVLGLSESEIRSAEPLTARPVLG